MKRSKAYRAAAEMFNADELYSPLSAVRLVGAEDVCSLATAKAALRSAVRTSYGTGQFPVSSQNTTLYDSNV